MPERQPLRASELPRELVLRHLHLASEYTTDEEWSYIQALSSAALSFVCDQCNVDAGYCDEHEDIAVAVLCITADMFDNRDYTAEQAALNPTVQTILSHHDHNLVEGMADV